MAVANGELFLHLGRGVGPDAQTVRLELDLPGRTFRANIMASGQAPLADLAPIAWRLSDALNEQTLARCQGGVCCRKGCDACCSYLVPLSVPEVLHLKQELDSLPPHSSRRLQEALLSASRELLSHTSTAMAQASVRDTADWYRSLGLRCPLAEGDLCGLYATRPLACREHFAVGPADTSNQRQCPGQSVFSQSVSVLEAMAESSAIVLGLPTEAIVLPLALPWLQSRPDLPHLIFPATELAQGFCEALTRQLNQRAAA